MNKNTTIIVFLIVLVIIMGLWVRNTSKETGQNNLNNNPAVSTTPTTQDNYQLFSDFPLFKNAYLISTPTYDAATQKALTGFTVTKKTLADGSMQITLNSQNTEYQTQTYTVKKGEKLYFIEKSLFDDTGNEDKSIKDDMAVLVDANGYMIQQ